MWRILPLVAALLATALAGCVARHTHETKMAELGARLEAEEASSAGLVKQLHAACAAKEEFQVELENAQAAAKRFEAIATKSAAERDAFKEKYDKLDSSLVGKLKGVPGAVVDREGAVQLTVSFALGGAELTAEVTKSLKEVANALAAQKGLVFVEGHSDNLPVGSPETRKRHIDNLGLSLARAAAVARVLIDGKVAAERLVVRGFGSAQPIASNDTPEGRAKNRRVEIHLVPAEAEKQK